MTHLRNAAYRAATATSKDRILTRMEATAEALPAVVASRDGRGVEALLATKTKVELQAIAVILASWVAEGDKTAAKGEAA